MMLTFPPDELLPGLATAMNEQDMLDIVARHLPDCQNGDLTPVVCRPTYIRYKPDASCLVQYNLALRSPNGETIETTAHITMFADDRGRRRWTNGRMRRITERAAEHFPEQPYHRAAYLADFQGLLQLFPIDYDLRRLVQAAVPDIVNDLCGEALPENARLRTDACPDVIRYKPGRKALLRFALDGDRENTLYVKLHTDDRGAALVQATKRLRAAGIATPRAVTYCPELQLIAHEHAAGTCLASLRGTDEFTAWMEPLATALSRLQSVDLPNLPDHGLRDEAETIQQTTAWLGRIRPDLSDRLTRLGEQIASELTNIPDRTATVHGDFYDDQALVSDAGIVILDLDELRRGHPLLDVGNMLAHLTAGAARGDRTEESREAFLRNACASRSGTLHEIALFEAAALVKLAPGPFRRLEPDWPEDVEQIVRLAEMRLARSQQTVSPRTQAINGTTPSSIDDPALPQLDILLNPIRMTAELAGSIPDRLANVQSIEVIRHKPGRRAILRYDVARNGCNEDSSEYLYGKTFASERGPRVYEITRTITSARAFGRDVALPDPVAFLPHLKLLVQRAVPGESVEPALLSGDQALADRIATALHALHASGLDLGRQHDLDKELQPLADRVAQIGSTAPDLDQPARHCLSRIDRARRHSWPWRWCPIHRDFYHDQVLIHDGKLAVLDLDDASMSEPAVDVANFAAHLRLLGIQQRDDPSALAPVRQSFIDRYRVLDPDIDAELLDLLEAATLLRLAGIHVPRPSGPRVAALLLQECETLLDRLSLERAHRSQ